jgi:Calcineurin-like phosphoesterase
MEIPKMNIPLFFVTLALSISLTMSGLSYVAHFDYRFLTSYGSESKNNYVQDDNSQLDAYEDFNFNDFDNNSKKPFNFAAVGDFGCSEKAKETAANIANKEPELVLTLGDLSYNETAACWFNVMSALKHKIMITFGYHDSNNKTMMDLYLRTFEMDKPYHSFDYRKVHFLVLASEFPFDKGSEQYNFVKRDLQEASDSKNINWIIVSTYGPLYTSPSKHKAYESLRDLYHPLFDKYEVDLVLQAHNHNYQRTYPITFNPDNSSIPVIRNNSQPRTIEHVGTIFSTVGTGGKSIQYFLGQYPYIATQFSTFGFLNVEINNSESNATLTGTFFDNKGNMIRDYFTIMKEIK